MDLMKPLNAKNAAVGLVGMPFTNKRLPVGVEFEWPSGRFNKVRPYGLMK